MKIIKVNCDLGEGIADEKNIMPYIQSCSIACGGHFGDKKTITSTILLAQKHFVKVGIHPSFPDKEGFGRRNITIDRKTLLKSIIEQFELFISVAKSLDQPIHHVKAHGALYNLAAKDTYYMEILLQAMEACSLKCPIYSAPTTNWKEGILDKYSIPWIKEGFGDRTYMKDGSLTSRKLTNSINENKITVWNQIVNIATKNIVVCIDGHPIHLEADTFCIHGDNINAVEIVQFIHRQKMNYE